MAARWLCLVLALIVLFPFCGGACPVECCPDTHQDAGGQDHEQGACGDCFCLKVVERPDAQTFFFFLAGTVPPLSIESPSVSREVFLHPRFEGSSLPRFLPPFLTQHAFLL